MNIFSFTNYKSGVLYFYSEKDTAHLTQTYIEIEQLVDTLKNITH